jgi:hypothetical protein
MKELREYEPSPISVGVLGCMDEALVLKSGSVLYGVGGAAVSTQTQGDMSLFTPEARHLTRTVRPAIYSSLSEISQSMGVPLAVVSHAGCGWAAGMGIRAGEIPYKTQQKVENSGVATKFAGHVERHHKPLNLDQEQGVAGCIIRPETEHLHSAKNIFLTVGGGVTQDEKNRLEITYNGPGFVVSVDYAAKAIEKGLKPKYMEDFLKLQIDVAYAIMNGAPLNFVVFDGQRMALQNLLNYELANEIANSYLR